MNTELTLISESSGLRGWVLYDGLCPVCRTWVCRLENALTRRGFDTAPLQTPWVQECLDIRIPDPPREMLVVTTAGRVYGGIDGCLFLARHIWWASPLYLLGLVPIVHKALANLYEWVAAHRICLGGSCAVPGGRRAG